MIMTLPDDYVAGHTGTPLPCSMIKLIDVPDMNVIVSRDNAGEVSLFGLSFPDYKSPTDLCERSQLHKGLL